MDSDWLELRKLKYYVTLYDFQSNEEYVVMLVLLYSKNHCTTRKQSFHAACARNRTF